MRQDLTTSLRRLPPSELRAVMEAGLGLDDVVPLWFGESDEPTPDVVKEAAIAALRGNETYYGSSAGLAPLVEAIERYTARLYGADLGGGRVLPTASGLQAIMMTLQALIEPGDEFLVLGPTWPNVRNAASLIGARVAQFDLDCDGSGAWRLDLARLAERIGPSTKILCVNSPANPTGWVATADELKALLLRCRQTGTWILSDEVYGRLVFDGPRAPSLLDVSEADDRVVIVNSFSKAWNMTGWRLGWLTLPAAVLSSFTQTIENNIANVPTFTQRAGVAALDEGEEFLADYRKRLRARRDHAFDALSRLGRVRVAKPDGAFYLFFSVDGVTDSVAFSQRLLREGRVGVAPGRAFGTGLESWMRLTFACSEARLDAAFERLRPYLG
jgi:aspartate/methionine/tyrosine aminotransferase